MITPSKMSELEQNKVIELYSKLNADLTSEIIKKIQKNKDLSTYTKAQIRQLIKQDGKELFYSALNRTNEISVKTKKELVKLFEEIQTEELKGYKNTYKEVGKELKLTPEMTKIINNLYKRTNKSLKNLTKSVAFNTKKTYTEAVDNLYMKVATGSQDYSSAMKNTINELSQEGIKLQSKGRNYKLESTVKMNLMTGLTQTANDLSKEIGNIIGANCVVIGHSPFCRPTHQVIDGVVMSLEKFKKYEYLTEEPNCYHIVNYDWREEFEDKSNKVSNNGHLTKSEYEENYETRQTQNYYARQVRDKKEQVSILNKSNEKNNDLTKAKKELRNAQIKYRQYCKKNNIEVDYNLTWKASYNK